MPDMAQENRRIRADQSGLVVAFPGGRGDGSRRSNLPAALSSFVGRERELTEIGDLFSDNRLLTLTGPGGVGKTRLALAAAGALVEVMDGVWMVEFAPLSDTSLVVQAVASVLRVREQPGRPLLEVLSDYLVGKRLLLVFDNCEHMLDACAELAATLLSACPELRVLCTSREALGIPGEIVWSVPLLTVPEPGQAVGLGELSGYEAVRLLVDRTTAVDRSFVLNDDNAAAVAQLCHRLQGIPLALELAAARAKVLSIGEIAARLDKSPEVLESGGRASVPRHRTLRATIDWSHELLTGTERTLFRRLAVFVGGFTLRAAEAVCSGEGLSAAEIFSVLSHLVDKSLVAVSDRGDESRYAMLDTVRRYADGMLQRSGETSSVRRAHAEFFMLFAETASDKVTGPDQPQWLRRLEAEHDNLRAAMTWGFEDDTSVVPAARMAVALREFWYTQGYLDEGRRWLETVAGRCASVPDLWRARALTGAALLALMQEAYDEAVAFVEEALTIDRRLDDKHEIVSSLIILSTVGMLGQRSDIAYVELLTEADTLKSALSDLRLVARLLDAEAAVALFVTRDMNKARSLWQQSLAISRDIGNQYGEADVGSSLGLLATADPDDEQATALLEDALRLGLKLDYRLVTQSCLMGLAKVAAARGQLSRAARMWAAAERIDETCSTHLTRGRRAMIGYEAAVAAARSRLDQASWAMAWAEGRALGPDEAGAYALQPDSDAQPASVPYPCGLSPRETEVLSLVAAGLTNAEVAGRLFLSVRTIEWHLRMVYTKLGLRSRTEATRFAVEHGLV